MVCKYKNQPVELSFCFFVLFSRGQSIAFKWNGKKDGRRIRPSSNKSLNKTTQEQGQEMHQPHHHQHRHQQHFDYSDCDKRPGGHETVSFNSSKKCKKGIGIIAFSEMVFFHCNFIVLYNFCKSTIFSISAHCWYWGWANSLRSTYKVWHWGYWDNMHLNQTGVSIISTSSTTTIGIQQLHILFYFFHFLAMCIHKWCVCANTTMYLIDQLMFFGLYKTGQSDWQCMSCIIDSKIYLRKHIFRNKPSYHLLNKYLSDSKPNKVRLIF